MGMALERRDGSAFEALATAFEPPTATIGLTFERRDGSALEAGRSIKVKFSILTWMFQVNLEPFWKKIFQQNQVAAVI